jgi:predicted regulator of Ras-like GTPase activity (Roadblock/LC7/MglB family)
MANIEESLDQIMKIDGAIGAALVDYKSGMTLGTIGGSKIDMELAGAGTTEVVRAEKEIIDQLELKDRIEDILISLETQYHLIRVFHQNDNIFTYLVLDLEKSNLALARMQLEEIDKALDLGLGGDSSGRSGDSGSSRGRDDGRDDSRGGNDYGGSSDGRDSRGSSGRNGSAESETARRR